MFNFELEYSSLLKIKHSKLNIKHSKFKIKENVFTWI